MCRPFSLPPTLSICPLPQGGGFFDAAWGYRRRFEGVDLYDEGPGKDFLTPSCHSAGSRIGLGRENINDDRM